ncbi:MULTISPECIES: DNA polymerase III subunit gamma and tau [Curtobacterium]|uniref:DNA polymerase III subunit gamma and tau n=1 Tax=Curtobacterium flaccumfaciens TaxID=2035 RepID=UPI003EE81A80
MVTALYRRYRPENFAELIGQSQVTDPLRTALRTNRVNHAYLFSGPRGCGKTTSARILARCLNCAEGPTDTPCGVCPSCVELARGGGGSLDVIEIDAASHNGVDDARDLRDRAVFAPARDRYKIFILDEAHMVTPQGFNALLKLVEEPPEHVMFIFATTEPEKVIGTIRSRTHHYPFRLVPPAAMLEYVEQLCQQESVSVAPGVLPLVVRAGGGSVRDTLSLLDQLIAGSEDGAIAYERAVALLGYTDAALLDDVVDALAVADPASAFAAVDRVVQTGQDPRRFVEDLLERLRDLIVVAATNESAAAVLRGVSPEELDTMTRQAGVFGATGLSRAADIANRALTEMTGATSPRLHLELMTARILVPESDDTQRGALARVERLERRIGVGDAGGHQAEPVRSAPTGSAVDASRTAAAAASRPAGPAAPSAAAPRVPAQDVSAQDVSVQDVSVQAPAARTTAPAARATAPTANDAGSSDRPADAAPAPVAPGAAARDAAASWAAAVPSAPTPEPAPTAESERPSAPVSSSSTGQGTAVGDEPAIQPVGVVGFQQMRDAWPQVVEHVQRAKRSAWSVVVTAQVTALRDDVLTLTFPSQQDVASFKEMSDPSASVSELLRAAIVDVLGIRVKFVARGPAAAGTQQRPAPEQQPQPQQQPQQRSAPEQQAQPQRAQPQRPAPEQQERRPQPQQRPVVEQQQEPQRDRRPQQQDRQPEPAQQPAEPSAPVTEWAVAAIPTTDPTAGAVPESVQPTWGAPFGQTDPNESVAPAEPQRPADPAADAALAAQLRPASSFSAPGRAASSSAASAEPAESATTDEPATTGDSATAAEPAPAAATATSTAPSTPVAAPSTEVPVDDYPLDDEPYDDGAPFPDPGYGRPNAARPQQEQQARPQQQAGQQQVRQQQAGPQQAGSQQTTRTAPTTTPAPQIRRTAVAGRYGEAVVREILGAQFIEETALHEDGA